MIKDVELVVVGGGPAGIEAAVTAAELGVDVTLVDLSPSLGGQYFQQFPKDFQNNKVSAAHDKAHQFIKRLNVSKVRVLNNTLVWGIFEGSQPGTWCLTLHGPDAPARLNARTVILATGAFDRSIPFPGWDLPGVITAGAALKMIKHQRVLPGKRIILSGTGPLQLQTCAYLVQAGAEVITVCESAASLLKRSVPFLPSIWGQWKRLKEGFGFLVTLAKARVPYRLGWAVTAVDGEERVAQATLQKLDINGLPISPGEIIQDIDTVIVGYGLTPSTELYRQISCKIEFDRLRGGFVPSRNQLMESSCPGIYAVGDGAGLGGAEMAIIEGRIAGYTSAARLGHLSTDAADEMIALEKPALRREARFARTLGALFSPPAGLYTLADPDTIICRCEQVTLAQMRQAIAFGAQTVNDVKNITRIGMGNCQSRTCGTISAQIMAAETDKTVEEVGYFNIRPPIHPLPLEVIEEFGKGSVPGVDQT